MSEETLKKYQTLVDRLYERTFDTTLVWQEDLVDPNSISCDVSGKNIELSETKSDTNNPLVVVTIRNEEGAVVDRFDDEDLRFLSVTNKKFDGYWPLLVAIFTMARRRNSGADVVLDSIIAELDEFPF